MSKKKHIHKKRKTNSFIRFYISASIVLLLMGFVQIFFTRSQNLPCANSGSCIQDLSGNYDAKADVGVFMGREVVSPQEDKTSMLAMNVLGETTEKKHIYVDLSAQRLYAYEGNKMVYNFLISSGKWGKTPTGDFRIWIKLRYTRMKGGDPANGTYYNLPNVPYTMYFYNDEVPKSLGYGIHGAYWHNNFGHPMSHGCINMKEEDVAQLYNWATPTTEKYVTYATSENPGTEITIYGVAPNE